MTQEQGNFNVSQNLKTHTFKVQIAQFTAATVAVQLVPISSSKFTGIASIVNKRKEILL